jgi:hypothetical protein
VSECFARDPVCAPLATSGFAPVVGRRVHAFPHRWLQAIVRDPLAVEFLVALLRIPVVIARCGCVSIAESWFDENVRLLALQSPAVFNEIQT